MKRTLAVLAPLALAACGPVEPESLLGRDLVIIVADSFSARHASLLGYERPTTPELEAFARTGVTFDNACSQTSWTLSSVTSLFTGVPQEVHDVLRSGEALDEGHWLLAEAFQQRGYETTAFVQNGAVSPASAVDRGFDRFELMPYDGLADDFAAAVAEHLRRPGDAPRFVYVHLAPPHMPYVPPPEFRARFEEQGGADDVTGSIMDVGIAMRDGLAPDSPTVRRLVDLYDGHIAYVDSLVGGLLDAIEEGRGLERSCVVFSSDHGEAFMEHGATGHNVHVYQDMVHIPLVIAAPGDPRLAPGERRTEAVTLMDLAPTLCHLFDVAPSADLQDGAALFRRGTEDELATRSLAFSSRFPGPDRPPTVQRALRRGRWKLVTRKDGGPSELYDLEADPREEHDLADRDPERVEAMEVALAEILLGYERRASDSESTELTSEMVEMLRSLGYGGYLESDPSDR